jgi:hypothetical protein
VQNDNFRPGGVRAQTAPLDHQIAKRGTRLVLPAILVSAAIGKCLLLLVVGPSFQPDSGGYVGFANSILNGAAFRPFDFKATALPNLAFRMAGYPLIIAASKLLSTGNWADIVVLLQCAVTLLTTAIIFVVLRRTFTPLWVPVFVAVLYLCSGSLLWDNSIMSDSLYASLFTIVIFVLLGALVGSWKLGRGAFGLGLLWGGSLLFRDSGIYFTVFPLALLCALTGREGGRAAASHVVSFLIAVGGVVGTYVIFNWYRTGSVFFGITGVANWLRPVFDMVRYNYANPFQGQDIVSTIMRHRPAAYDFPAQLQFLNVLHQSCSCSPVRMDSIVLHKFVSTVLHHPFAYLGVVWHNFNYIGLGSLLVDPVATINQFAELGTHVGHRIIPGLSMHHIAALHAHFSMSYLVLMILATISTTISTLLFSLFVLGVPYFAYRDLAYRARRDGGGITPRILVGNFAWIGFMTFSIAFSMVHYEARHALPILPLGLTGIAHAILRVEQIWCR